MTGDEAPQYVYTIGVSCAEIRLMVVEYILDKIKPEVILDLGCGTGCYGYQIKRGNEDIVMIGLDGHMRYLTSYHMIKYYDIKIHCRIEDYMKGRVRVPYDIVLFMDGPEHFEKDTAYGILNRLCRVIVSTPLFKYEQGVVEGNKLEIHRCYFTEKEINDLGYRTLFKVKYDERGEIGAFTKGLP